MRRLALALLRRARGVLGGRARRVASTAKWRPLAPATLARTEVAAARVGRFVYVMGGFERGTGATVAVTERYDLRRDRWRRVADMPVGAQPRRGGRLPRQRLRRRRLPRPAARSTTRSRRSTATSRGATAGRGCRRCRRGAARSPPPWSATASTRSAAPRPAAARSPRSRSTTSARAAGRPGRTCRSPASTSPRRPPAGSVYALAGRAAGQGNFARVDRYDPARRRWTRVRDMGKPRGGIAAATVGGRIAVFGGEEGAGTIREVELYDPARNRWRRLPGHAHAAPRARRRRRPGGASTRSRAATSPGSTSPARWSTSTYPGRRSSTRYAFWSWPCWKEASEQVAARQRVDAARLGRRRSSPGAGSAAGIVAPSGISSCGSRSPGRKNSACVCFVFGAPPAAAAPFLRGVFSGRRRRRAAARRRGRRPRRSGTCRARARAPRGAAAGGAPRTACRRGWSPSARGR